MLTLGKDRRLGVGVEYTDFQLGYQIVDGRLMEYLEKRSHVNDEWTKETWGADAVEDSETDFTPKTLEERYHEEVSKLFLSVREFYPESTPMEFVVKGQKITRNFSQGKLLLDYIEQIVSSQNIAWATEADGKPNREDNKELSDDLRDELFVDIMKQVNLGTKLGQRYKELSGYWGDALSVRFSWAVQYFSKIFKDRENDENLVQEFAPKFIKVIESKTNKKVSKEEGKLIWSLLGLINAGFNPRAPILHASFDSEDRDSFKAVCKIVGSYLYWSINLKQFNETQSDGQEPLALVEEDDKSGPHYTLDFNDIMMQIQSGSGEAEFNECFSKFEYEDKETGVEKTIVYRKSSGWSETTKSVNTAVELGNWLMMLYAKGINLHTFRTKFPKNPAADNLNILSYIAYKAGRRWTNVIREIDVEDIVDGKRVVEKQRVNAKKMSDKILLDFNEKKVIELFWSLYNSQKEMGIIKPSVKTADMAEAFEG